MNEENNNVMEDINDDTDISEVSDGFDDGWGDAPEEVEEGGFDIEDPVDEQDDTDEPTQEETEGESGEDNAAEERPEQSPRPTDEAKKTYTLKGIGGEQTVSEEEYRVYAQKGLDYDGLRADRDKLREENGRFTQQEAFLKELAEQSGFEDVQELIDNTRARIYKDKMAEEGKEISDFEALHHVQREAQKAAQTAKAAEKTDEEKRSAEIAAFVKEFPNVKAEQIPSAVWEGVGKGGSLIELYRNHVSGEKDAEIARLKSENEKLKTYQKNRERSTGSLRSSGSAPKKDAFDEGWDS